MVELTKTSVLSNSDKILKDLTDGEVSEPDRARNSPKDLLNLQNKISK